MSRYHPLLPGPRLRRAVQTQWVVRSGVERDWRFAGPLQKRCRTVSVCPLRHRLTLASTGWSSVTPTNAQQRKGSRNPTVEHLSGLSGVHFGRNGGILWRISGLFRSVWRVWRESQKMHD